MKLQEKPNPLVVLITRNFFGGCFLGIILAAVLLAFNLANLRSLILAGDNAMTATIIMFVCSASTFSTAAISGAIMLLSEKDDEPDFSGPGGGRCMAVCSPLAGASTFLVRSFDGLHDPVGTRVHQ